MKHTLALILALSATPSLAVYTKPEPPKEEQPDPEPPKEQPAKERKSKPEPKAEARPSREPERESECPYTRTKANNWQCVATVRPRARPVTNQVVPAGELK